jgi:hypothetical protein
MVYSQLVSKLVWASKILDLAKAEIAQPPYYGALMFVHLRLSFHRLA